MKKLLITLLFANMFCLAQTENIMLPNTKNEFKLNIDSSTPIVNIHIDLEENIYIEGIKVELDEILCFLQKHKSNLDVLKHSRIKYFLLADSRLNYSVIDKLKTVLSKAEVKGIIYRVNDMNDSTLGLGLKNHSHIINTKNSIIEEQEFLFDEVVIKKHPIAILEENLYSLRINKVRELLKKYRYKSVEFIGDLKVKINDEEFKIDDDELIYSKIKDLDFFYIHSSENLTFNDYFLNISSIIKIFRNYTFGGIPIIEVSNDLKKELYKKEFKI